MHSSIMSLSLVQRSGYDRHSVREILTCNGRKFRIKLTLGNSFHDQTAEIMLPDGSWAQVVDGHSDLPPTPCTERGGIYYGSSSIAVSEYWERYREAMVAHIETVWGAPLIVGCEVNNG